MSKSEILTGGGIGGGGGKAPGGSGGGGGKAPFNAFLHQDE